MTITLPTNPSPSQATVGKDYLLKINTGTVAIPTWTLIGGQRSGTLTRKAESIDASNKTTGGWTTKLPGLLSWSIALDGLVMLNDVGVEALEQAFGAGTQIEVQFVYPDGSYRTGWAAVTDLSIDNQYNQAATLKVTLEGCGSLSELQTPVPVLSPTAATASIAAAVDKVFMLTPSTTAIASIVNGAQTLTANTDYMYYSGTLTIKAAYIDGLTAGNYTLKITDANANTINLSLTVTA